MKDLYRGKHKDTKNWVQGSLIKLRGKTFICEEGALEIGGDCDVYINNDVRKGKLVRCRVHEVIPNTVCQCVGMRDSNKKPIFDGDILRGAWKTYIEVFWHKFSCGFQARKCGSTIYHDIDYYHGREGLTVVGNKFDNPEMLKVKE